MPIWFRNLVAWTLLPQVLLVGGLGAGLHGLFGCEHGRGDVCPSACCVEAKPARASSDCPDCAFCRHAAVQRVAAQQVAAQRVAGQRVAGQQDLPGARAPADRGVATVSTAGCDGCAVCDLLAQYHSATPFELETSATELASGQALLQRQNAVVAASIRLAFSRGPPAV